MITRHQHLAFILATACLLVSSAARANGDVYYISMRGLQTEAVPSYVEVSAAPTAQRTTAVSACNGQSYYATPPDASTISTARAAGEVVHLHRGQAGAPPSVSRIICMIDAAGP